MAIENKDKAIFGLQYHPEVHHSVHGKEQLQHFLTKIAGFDGDWRMENVLEQQMDKIRQQVGLMVQPGCGEARMVHDSVLGRRWGPLITSSALSQAGWTVQWLPPWCTRCWGTACTASLWTTASCATRCASLPSSTSWEPTICTSPTVGAAAECSPEPEQGYQPGCRSLFWRRVKLPCKIWSLKMISHALVLMRGCGEGRRGSA